MYHYYDLHTKSNGTLRVQGNYANTNAATVGSANSYTFYLIQSKGNITFTEDDTIFAGDIERYDSVTIESGVTLTVNGTLQCTSLTVNGTLDNNGTVTVDSNLGGERNTLLPYSEWSGKYNTTTMVDGTLKFTDRIPSTESVDSIVLGIEPATDLQSSDVSPVWALVDSVSDQRTGPLATDRIGLEVTVLAPYADYTRTEIESNLKLV
jgi:hypothetical protein